MAMEPAWTQFESAFKKKVNLVMINVDLTAAPEFKKYGKYGNDGIPATYWLDSKGKVLQSKVGGLSAKQLGDETTAASKKAR